MTREDDGMIPFAFAIKQHVEWRYTSRGKLNSGTIRGIDRAYGRPVYLVETDKGIKRVSESLLCAQNRGAGMSDGPSPEGAPDLREAARKALFGIDAWLSMVGAKSPEDGVATLYASADLLRAALAAGDAPSRGDTRPMSDEREEFRHAQEVTKRAIRAFRPSPASGEAPRGDAKLLDDAADYIESMACDLQFNVPEPSASEAAACRRAAARLRASTPSEETRE